MRCVMVSHTHWDREWYRTFQAFRARLVDTIDRVLELVSQDPDYHFQLDGQGIVIEDYLEIRPERRDDLIAACRSGRVAVGPWYVQPDSFLPSGESHIRNLLEGRRVANEIGSCSTIAYTPDSFGHPSQFPQIFAGFGLDPFIYWRGNGDELDSLPAEYRWFAPDGSYVRACHLGKGYFGAWGLGDNVEMAVNRLRQLTEELAEKATSESVLLMNGIDHMLPDTNTREVAGALAKDLGCEVQRGLLDDFVSTLGDLDAEYTGELMGGRAAHLLPGVWSTRTYLKLLNRRCETQLEGWAEPWAAISQAVGGPRESAALRTAWRALLPNQAHDSICGCSQDRVHEHMVHRFEEAEELASETTTRLLDRLAGLGPDRQPASGDELEIAVFNPSPHPRTDVVRLALEGYPAFTSRGIHPLLVANAGIGGFEVGGAPARVIEHEAHVRPHLAAGQPVHDLEFVARDVPAFGWKRLSLRKTDAHTAEVDTGRRISAGGVAVEVTDDGLFDVTLGDHTHRGLGGLEDIGDRGDTYDFDPVPGDDSATAQPDRVEVQRTRHESGIETLEVRRRFELPARLGEDRASRSAERVELWVTTELRVAPDVERVDVRLSFHNEANDHRLRILFPPGARDTGTADAEFLAATTLDTALRSSAVQDASKWIHPAPTTFPHQGWISGNGLTVVAPGLPEAEITEAGAIAVTLIRCVGWLSRGDLVNRTGEAGPALPTPGAQCRGRLDVKLHLLPGHDPAAARAAELGLRSVLAGPDPLIEPDSSLLSLEPSTVELSALKPSEDGRGLVLRLLNRTDSEQDARVRIGFDVSEVQSVRLDESASDADVVRDGPDLRLSIPAHGSRSVLLRS